MSENTEQVRVPETQPVVENGIPPTDRATAIPQGFLKKAAPRPSPFDVNLLCRKDTKFRQLQAKETQLASRKLPSRSQVSAAWAKVVKAYWDWANLEVAELYTKQDLEEVRAQMRKRKLFLQKTATANLIHRLRQTLGGRFRKLATPSVALSPKPKSFALSSSATSTSPSPEKSLEQPASD